MKNAGDKDFADKFITDCQARVDQVYEKGNDLGLEQEQELVSMIFQAQLYKLGKIDQSLGLCDCAKRFNGLGVVQAVKIYYRKQVAITIVLLINVVVQLVLTIEDQMFESTFTEVMAVNDIIDHRNKVDFPLMSVQIAMGFYNIYQILVLVKFQQSIYRKDDPVHNGHLICIQLFFVTIQRMIFTSFLGPSINAKTETYVTDP